MRSSLGKTLAIWPQELKAKILPVWQQSKRMCCCLNSEPLGNFLPQGYWGCGVPRLPKSLPDMRSASDVQAKHNSRNRIFKRKEIKLRVIKHTDPEKGDLDLRHTKRPRTLGESNQVEFSPCAFGQVSFPGVCPHCYTPETSGKQANWLSIALQSQVSIVSSTKWQSRRSP